MRLLFPQHWYEQARKKSIGGAYSVPPAKRNESLNGTNASSDEQSLRTQKQTPAASDRPQEQKTNASLWK